MRGGRLPRRARSDSGHQREFSTIKLDSWQSFGFLGTQAGRRTGLSTGNPRTGEICKKNEEFCLIYAHAGVSLAFDGCLLQVLAMNPIKQKYDRNALPTSFDGRIEWRDTLQQVRDQGW